MWHCRWWLISIGSTGCSCTNIKTQFVSNMGLWIVYTFCSFKYWRKYIILFTQPLHPGTIWHKVNFFKAEFNRFEFRVFLLLDLLPHQGWRTQSVLLITHNWRENNWIHTFPKGISAIWNAISLVEDLNSCRRVHFLHHGHLKKIYNHGRRSLVVWVEIHVFFYVLQGNLLFLYIWGSFPLTSPYSTKKTDFLWLGFK